MPSLNQLRSQITVTVLVIFSSVVLDQAIPATAIANDTFVLPEKTVLVAESLRDKALESSNTFSIVESLTMEVGHRSAGSAGDKAAVEWALKKFKQYGFANIRAEPVVVPHWERGHTEVTIASPFPQQLVAIAIGGSIGTPEAGVEGEVIAVDSLENLKSLTSDVIAGKIVYVGDRMEVTQDALGYVAAVQKRAYGPSEAAARGATALLIRSAGTSSNRFAHTGAMRTIPGARPIPSFALANSDADLLERQLASGKSVTVRIKSSARHLPDTVSANVIGEIRGRSNPEEIILLGAHLDSWDQGTGALDDGAGVAIVMEAARLIGELKPRPKRTIRVVLYANEEFGLSGAIEYAARYANQLDNHVIAMEADLGADSVFRLESRVADEAIERVHAMHLLLEPLGVELGANTAFGGADISKIRDLGVPVLGPRQDASRYFSYHHTQDDTLDKVDKQGIRQNTAVYAVLAYLASEIEEGFGRIPLAPPVAP